MAQISTYAKIAAMPAPTTHTKQPSSKTSAKPQTPNEAMASSVQRLSVNSVHSAGSLPDPNGDSADSYEEDQSQMSSSSLNKPQSFDTKSLASVTTFAMDDKESIRPDDSASVRAADDEHTQPALSRNSSFQQENDQPLHRLARTFPSNVTIPGRRFPTLANPPRFGNLPISPVIECQDVQMPKDAVQVISPDDPRDPSTVINSPPDEKLLDALASAKDRFPLLQLEEKLLSFLRIGNSNILDLPPQNSFNRLLTHKLADYYRLAHAVADDNASVRIFRAPQTTLPTPLTEIARSIHVGTSAAPSATAVKIMRREQLAGRHFSAGNSTAPSSSVPSKATSETGGEGPSDDGLASPTESTPSQDKSKMTREERETQYKLARDRIFADFQELTTNEILPTDENSASISRSSSSSGKRKSKKHKQPKDDSFEARSAYIASYTPFQAQYANAYVNSSSSNGFPASTPSYDQSMYNAMSGQTFSGYDVSMQYPSMQGYHPSMVQHFAPGDWQAMQAMQAMQMQNAYMMYPQTMQFPQTPNTIVPNMQAAQSPMSEWYPNQMNNYMGNTHAASPSMYPHQNGNDLQSPDLDESQSSGFQRAYFSPSLPGPQHGHKGSKSLFNPQTRSFIPNNAEGRSNHRSGRFKNQSRNNSTANNQTFSGNHNTFVAKEDSLKLKYGTPASLPKKPPPPGVRRQQENVPVPAGPASLTENSLPVVNGVEQRA